LLISIPHLGTQIPADVAATMTPVAQRTDDCDWHLDRLYAFAKRMGASILSPTYARYVIDLNRPPDGANLYPGQDTTGLLPVDTFDKEPLYLEGHLPTDAEVARRRDAYWKPYHDALAGELAALKAKHGKVLLWEAHSIRSHVPRFSKDVCRISTSARRTAPVRWRDWARNWPLWSDGMADIPLSPTGASRAGISRGSTGSRRRACMRSSSSCRRLRIWKSRCRMRMTKRWLRRSSLCWKNL
jgi:N-formylglutamate amidohydrolase